MPAIRTRRRRKPRKPIGFYASGRQESDEELLPESTEPDSEKWEIGARVNKKGLWEYLVKWADFPSSLATWEPANGGLRETNLYLSDFHKEAEDQGRTLEKHRKPGFKVLARREWIKTAKESFKEHRKLRRDTGIEDNYNEEKAQEWFKTNKISQMSQDTDSEEENLAAMESLRISEDPETQTLVDDDNDDFVSPPPFNLPLPHTENSSESESDFDVLFDAELPPERPHRGIKIREQPNITDGSLLSTKRSLNKKPYASEYKRSERSVSREISPQLVPNEESDPSFRNKGLDQTLTSAAAEREDSVESEYY